MNATRVINVDRSNRTSCK